MPPDHNRLGLMNDFKPNLPALPSFRDFLSGSGIPAVVPDPVNSQSSEALRHSSRIYIQSLNSHTLHAEEPQANPWGASNGAVASSLDQLRTNQLYRSQETLSPNWVGQAPQPWEKPNPSFRSASGQFPCKVPHLPDQEEYPRQLFHDSKLVSHYRPQRYESNSPFPYRRGVNLTKAGKPRKRSERACTKCRNLKVKCEPSVPKCIHCWKRGYDCDIGKRTGEPEVTTDINGSDNGDSSQDKSSAPHSPQPSTHVPSPILRRSPRQRDSELPTMSVKRLLSESSAVADGLNNTSGDGMGNKRRRLSMVLKSPELQHGSKADIKFAMQTPMPELIPPRFDCEIDPWIVDPNLTMYHLGHFFNNLDPMLQILFPKEVMLPWVSTCVTKSKDDIMMMYSILALGSAYVNDLGSEGSDCNFADIAHFALVDNSHRKSIQTLLTLVTLATLALLQGNGLQARDLCDSLRQKESTNELDWYASAKDARLCDTWEYLLDNTTLTRFWRNIYRCGNVIGSLAASYSVVTSTWTRFDAVQTSKKRNGRPDSQHLEPTVTKLTNGSLEAASNSQPLEYLTQITGILRQVTSYMDQQIEGSVEDASREQFYNQALKQIQDWNVRFETESLLKSDGTGKCSWSAPEIRILYHYTMLLLNRHVSHAAMGTETRHSHLRHVLFNAIQIIQLSLNASGSTNDQSIELKSKLLNPAMAIGVATALDVITAAGFFLDLSKPKSQTMSRIAAGLESLDRLAELSVVGQQQRNSVRQRCSTVLRMSARSQPVEKACFCFRRSTLASTRFKQDVVYDGVAADRLMAWGGGDGTINDRDIEFLDESVPEFPDVCS